MSISGGFQSSYWDHWQSSGAKVDATVAEPDRYNFLSFLTTAQALEIEFPPLAWDAARGSLGTGGTSVIHQALMNADTSFAFKTHHKRGRTEEQVFRTLINEITVMSQAFVREHANIAQLQGVCWGISRDDKPWPVLVFEKAHFGDLDHFARQGGKDMKIDERLALCLDIGRAVTDMHANRIVHGDIKPDNVLVFKEKSGEYHAKVIDFGYSARYIDDNHRLILTGTELWNAPEHGSCSSPWTLSQAVKADLFSLGMLFLWLLFEPCLSGTAPLPQGAEVADTGLARDTLYREKRRLQTYARLLLASETALEEDERMALGEFFGLSLSEVPEQREMNLLELLRKLDPHRTNVQEVGLNRFPNLH